MFFLHDIINHKKYSSFEILELLEKEDIKNISNFFIDRKQACTVIKQIAEYYIVFYKNYLNKKYKINFPLSFYKQILNPYLISIITSSYSSFLYCREFYTPNSDIAAYLSFDTNIYRVFETSDEFFSVCFSDINFHKFLYSIILSHVAGENKTIRKTQKNKALLFKKEEKLEKKYHSKNLKNQFSLKDKILKYINLKLSFKNIYGFTIYENLFLSTILSVKSLFLTKKYIMSDNRLTKNDPLKNIDGLFLAIIDDIIKKTIPKSFVENFQKSLIKYLYKDNFFKKIVFDSGAVFYSDAIIFHALRKLKGCLICFAQHGAGYATHYPFKAEAIEFLSDKFIFFGKEYPENNTDCEFLNAPSPMLSRLKNTHIQSRDEIIFLGTAITPCWDGIFYQNSSKLGVYLKSKKIFLSTINEAVFNKLLYKTYPSPTYEFFDESKFISDLFSSLKIMDIKCNLEENIKHSKIIVVDHYEATTFYKALAANCPIIYYTGLPFFQLYPKAEKLHEKLKKVNIAFEDAKSAAQFINEKWEDIDSWWSSNEVQSVREEFCELYCRSDKNYFFKWIKLILKL